jgi:hypothetical protein
MGQITISKIENANPAKKLQTLFSLLEALDLESEIKPRSKATPTRNGKTASDGSSQNTHGYANEMKSRSTRPRLIAPGCAKKTVRFLA